MSRISVRWVGGYQNEYPTLELAKEDILKNDDEVQIIYDEYGNEYKCSLNGSIEQIYNI